MTSLVSIFDNIQYGEKSPKLNVLINSDYSKEILITFLKGQVLKEHNAPYPIVIHIIEGSIDFGINGQRILLNKGNLITLEAKVLHDLIANEDSIVRLSLLKSNIS